MKNHADVDPGCWGKRPASRSVKYVASQTSTAGSASKRRKDREPFCNASFVILGEYNLPSRV